ncbi:hypothetical protein niasHT_001453 [Heterodera trifolii]|uniref:Exoribonuclease phosphorolytic domain-containing protein n=1 Tax=Heterodera trifolii TaxID=157864 RepID=A0ABD2M4H5_9BILA
MSRVFATQSRFLRHILPDGQQQQQQQEDGDDDVGQRMEEGMCGTGGTPLANIDQQQPFAWRKIVVRSNPLSGGDCSSGSASIDMGNTRVMCTVNGPRELQQQSVSSSADAAASMEEGVLCVTLRGCDIDASLRYSVERALQAAVCLRKLARTETAIELNVLSDDGGAFAACLVAAGVAIASANIEMLDVLLACNVLLIPSNSLTAPLRIVFDPDKATIAAHAGKASTLTMGVIPTIGQVVCAELCGDACPLPAHQLRGALSDVYEHCLTLYGTVRAALLKGVTEGAL